MGIEDEKIGSNVKYKATFAYNDQDIDIETSFVWFDSIDIPTFFIETTNIYRFIDGYHELFPESQQDANTRRPEQSGNEPSGGKKKTKKRKQKKSKKSIKRFTKHYK